MIFIRLGLPLCAVGMTWFTVTLPVWIFENKPFLSIIYSSRARRHAERSILEVTAGYTFICTLEKIEMLWLTIFFYCKPNISHL